jgi:Bifunctional DNA primase/polymerase, N-terminal
VKTKTNNLLAEAKKYIQAFDWVVIPMAGKKPMTKWSRWLGLKPTSRQTSGQFSKPGVTGLAIVVGSGSNKTRVRDFDTEESYKTWSVEHPELSASLPTVKTSRGFHVYFRADIEDKVTPLDDGELRAGNGLVVLPPSIHPEGPVYKWTIPPTQGIPFLENVSSTGLLGTAKAFQEMDPSRTPQPVLEAITQSLPAENGERVQKIFEFVRRLKSIADIDISEKAVLVYFQEWFQQALPFIKTKEYDTSEIDFFSAWDNAKTPLSDHDFPELIKTALSRPDPEWFTNLYFPEVGKRLLKICDELQKHHGEEPFYLSARKAGQAVGIAGQDANTLLKNMAFRCFIRLEQKGVFNGGASTYRYLGYNKVKEPPQNADANDK